MARNRPGDLDDDSLPLAAQARQQGGWYGLFLFGLMLLLGVAVLVVLVLGSGHLAGT